MKPSLGLEIWRPLFVWMLCRLSLALYDVGTGSSQGENDGDHHLHDLPLASRPQVQIVQSGCKDDMCAAICNQSTDESCDQELTETRPEVDPPIEQFVTAMWHLRLLRHWMVAMRGLCLGLLFGFVLQEASRDFGLQKVTSHLTSVFLQVAGIGLSGAVFLWVWGIPAITIT